MFWADRNLEHQEMLEKARKKAIDSKKARQQLILSKYYVRSIFKKLIEAFE